VKQRANSDNSLSDRLQKETQFDYSMHLLFTPLENTATADQPLQPALEPVHADKSSIHRATSNSNPVSHEKNKTTQCGLMFHTWSDARFQCNCSKLCTAPECAHVQPDTCTAVHAQPSAQLLDHECIHHGKINARDSNKAWNAPARAHSDHHKLCRSPTNDLNRTVQPR
jgi:hypothetical protein